jgi:hypothetical protein
MARNAVLAAKRDLVEAIGAQTFAKLEAAAMVRLKEDARLCEATKIRLAYEAALRAAGFPFRLVPKEILDEAMIAATAAAQAEFQVVCDEAMTAAAQATINGLKAHA